MTRDMTSFGKIALIIDEFTPIHLYGTGVDGFDEQDYCLAHDTDKLGRYFDRLVSNISCDGDVLDIILF